MQTPIGVLPYHTAIADHLEKEERDLWQWFQSDDFSAQYADHIKLELLKSTYRLSREDHPKPYALADLAAQRLGLTLPLTLYHGQAHSSQDANAALIYFPDELAIMLMGSIRDLLNEQELLAVLGHEIAHHLLYSQANRRFFTTARLLEWCATQPICHDAFKETERLNQLYTEIYADSGALIATDSERDVVIATLVKTTMGLKDVSAAAYLQQSDEILAQQKKGSQGLSHPETYIRAKTLDLFASDPPQLSAIAELVEGPLEAKSLDILGQIRLTEITRKLIHYQTANPLMQNEFTLNLLQRYFSEAKWPQKQPASDALATSIQPIGSSSREYLSYVLLDFASATPDDNDAALGWSLHISKQIGLYDDFEAIARKVLGHKKSSLNKLLQTTKANAETNHHA